MEQSSLRSQGRSRAFFLLSFLSILELCVATQYPIQWNLGSSDYGSSNSYKTGDSLLFKYDSSHNVLSVSKSDYQACSSSSPLSSYSDGNTLITLSSPGTYYFICGTPGHCAAGMKFSVDVLSSSPSTPPPTSSPPPSPSTSSPPPVYSAPPPSPSASSPPPVPPPSTSYPPPPKATPPSTPSPTPPPYHQEPTPSPYSPSPSPSPSSSSSPSPSPSSYAPTPITYAPPPSTPTTGEPIPSPPPTPTTGAPGPSPALTSAASTILGSISGVVLTCVLASLGLFFLSALEF